MLSILIPTYNYDCTALVEALTSQIEADKITAEIIVANDCSTIPLPDFSAISPYCRDIKPEHNLGRAAIRNFLAKNAKYDYLLFIDSDSLPYSDKYLSNFIAKVRENRILLGGRVYNTPSDEHHTLLPKYGQMERNVEDIENCRPPFTSPNFLIPRKIFSTIGFNEELSGYGHEDTILGIELLRHGAKYYKIDNPVIHLQIEDNITFLSKTRNAVDVLYQLYKSGKYPELESVSSLLKLFIKIKKLRLNGICSKIFKKKQLHIERKLDSRNPSMRLFALYKLLYLCCISGVRS